MARTFKEYISYLGGYRIGNLDSFQPMASLGDIPPKGQGGRDSRGVGLNSGSRGLPLKANYTGQAPGTMRPFLTAAKKIQDKNKKDKKKVKEDKDMEDFLNDIANNTPNSDQFDEVSDKLKLKVLARKIKRLKDKAFKRTFSSLKSPLFAGEDA